LLTTLGPAADLIEIIDLEDGVTGVLETARRVHFIGIGGVGMSALAELLHHRGYEVTGSDREASDLTRRAERLGMVVRIGHEVDAVARADLVVYTAAVDDDNPEIVEARERGLPVIRRADLLGEVTRGKQLIAVAGTHGKTTTTAMVTSICVAAGLDPTALIGGTLPGSGQNLLLGGDRVWITEADEYDRSFLALSPTVAVVTSLEADHLDCYEDLDDIVATFNTFLERLPEQGTAVVCTDTPASLRLSTQPPVISTSFGLDSGSLRAESVAFEGRGSRFEVTVEGELLGSISLSVPGRHNVSNALGAIGAALAIDVEWEAIAAGLGGFAGVDRRFEILFESDRATVISDYAHHPTEVARTLEAARTISIGGRVVAVFQPHLYSRTRDFSDAFGEALSMADQVWVTDIYPAREEPLVGVTGMSVAELVKAPVSFEPSLSALPQGVYDTSEPGDTIVVMGAGSIVSVAEELAGLFESAG
jgi:UDP-N-acetylmuramate--alanine ligase